GVLQLDHIEVFGPDAGSLVGLPRGATGNAFTGIGDRGIGRHVFAERLQPVRRLQAIADQPDFSGLPRLPAEYGGGRTLVRTGEYLRDGYPLAVHGPFVVDRMQVVLLGNERELPFGRAVLVHVPLDRERELGRIDRVPYLLAPRRKVVHVHETARHLLDAHRE